CGARVLPARARRTLRVGDLVEYSVELGFRFSEPPLGLEELAQVVAEPAQSSALLDQFPSRGRPTSGLTETLLQQGLQCADGLPVGALALADLGEIGRRRRAEQLDLPSREKSPLIGDI